MGDVTFDMELIFGHVELRNVYKIEGGTLHIGGYSIRYDQHGKETSRTEPTFTGSMTGPWHDHLPLLVGYERLPALSAKP